MYGFTVKRWKPLTYDELFQEYNVDSVATIHITDTNVNLRIHKLIIV